MAQYDGSVRINTEITIKQAEKELKSLESSISKTADKIASLRSKMNALETSARPTEEYLKLHDYIQRAEYGFSKLLEKQEQMQSEGRNSGEEWERLNVEIETIGQNIHNAQAYMQKLVDTGKAFNFGAHSDEYAQMSAEMQRLNQKMESDKQRQSELQSVIVADEERLAQIRENAIVEEHEIIDLLGRRREVLQEMADLQKAGVGEGYQEYYDAQDELSYINQRIDEIRQGRNEVDEMRASYVRLGDAVKNAFKSMAHGLVDIPLSDLKAGLRGAVSLFKGLGDAAVSALKQMGSAIQQFAIYPFRLLGAIAKKAFSSIGKSSKSSNNILNKGFKAILKYGLGIRSMYILINKLRTAIKEGFSNLYNDKNIAAFKTQVDSLKASLLTLKNSFAAAFRPLVEVAIPYIQMLIDYMIRLLNVVGQFMAAITGQDKYTRAVRQTTAAIEEQNKAQKKQLSNLDSLNNLASDNSSGGKDTTGMFEEVPVEDKWQDIVDRLKKMWENSDFSDLGKSIGEWLKNALDGIPWNEIKEKARKLGESIATLINGFIEVNGLGYSIGHTLAESINTGFAFLNDFVRGIHADSAGKFLAETINGITESIEWDTIYDTFTTGAHKLAELLNNFFSPDNLNYAAVSSTISNFVNTIVESLYVFITETEWDKIGESLGETLSNAWTGIDWAKAGETLGEYFKAFFDFVGKAIEAVDWWAVGESVKDFLVGIDWAGVADSFFEAVGAAFGGLAAFLGGLIAEGVVSAAEYFQDKIEDAGGNVVEGILVGIAEALVGIGDWIKEHIFNPFINGFKKAFEIHSPSKVMSEMGGFIVSGLLDGLKEKWKSVVDWITEKINWLKDKLSGIAGKVTSAFTGGWNSSAKSGSRSTLFSTPAVSTPYAANPAFAALSTAPIPKLATGAVIPANKEFLAVLGDQKHGTNIEAPIGMIEEAVINAMAKVNANSGSSSGGNITLEIPVVINGIGEIGRAVQQFDREFFKQSGRHAFT